LWKLGCRADFQSRPRGKCFFGCPRESFTSKRNTGGRSTGGLKYRARTRPSSFSGGTWSAPSWTLAAAITPFASNASASPGDENVHEASFRPGSSRSTSRVDHLLVRGAPQEPMLNRRTGRDHDRGRRLVVGRAASGQHGQSH
jgi:hypothetical protein